MYSGHPTKALEHIRRATKLDPESVAAWSLLEKLGSITRNLTDSTAKLEQLSPTTHLDYLFLGQRGYWGTPETISLIEKAIKKRDSPLARMALAGRLSSHAIRRTKNWDEMMRACSDMMLARNLAGNSHFVAVNQMTVFD